MALGRQGEWETALRVGWAALPRSPGHVFDDRLQAVLVGVGTPREFLARASARLLVLATADGAALILLTVPPGSETAVLAVSFKPNPPG